MPADRSNAETLGNNRLQVRTTLFELKTDGNRSMNQIERQYPTKKCSLALITVVFLICQAAHAQSLEDVWSGRAVCIIENRTFGANFGMHFISTYQESSSSYLAYYIAGTNRGPATGLATTRDGINFTNSGTVIAPGPSSWDNRMASFPGVALLTPGRLAVVYEGAGSSPGDIGFALSADGRTFTKDLKPILVHGVRQPNEPKLDLSWERNNIGTPSIVVDGGTRYLFYHGFGKSSGGGQDDCQVGVATGTDLRNLVRYSGNPILRTGVTGSWDSGTIGKRSIKRGGDGYWYMVYEGSTDQPYEKAVWSTGLARSRDLLNWQKYSGNPILPKTVSGFGNDGPEIVAIGGRTYIYFRATGGTTKRAIIQKK